MATRQAPSCRCNLFFLYALLPDIVKCEQPAGENGRKEDISEDKVQECRGMPDMLGLMQQIGAVPAPEQLEEASPT